jgi:hypothetical protein
LFWRFIKEKQKTNKSVKEVNISPSKLLEQYSKLFNDKNILNNSFQVNIAKEVEKNFKNYSKPNNIPYFSYSTLENMIKKLEDSNVRGVDIMCYSLLKNANSFKFNNILLKLFNNILQSGFYQKKLINL